MKVFVVNAYKDRKEKYDERYELYPAVWWENVSEQQVERYHFRHNANMEYRKKVVACSLSHKNLLQKIIDEDLKDIIIIEDDAMIDKWDRLEELEDVNEFCYIGGDITSPLLKDMKRSVIATGMPFRRPEKADPYFWRFFIDRCHCSVQFAGPKRKGNKGHS